MHICTNLHEAISVPFKDTSHVLAVRSPYLIQTVSVLKAKARGQEDNMEVCILQVWQERNKPMVWIISQTVLCKGTEHGHRY